MITKTVKCDMFYLQERRISWYVYTWMAQLIEDPVSVTDVISLNQRSGPGFTIINFKEVIFTSALCYLSELK